MGIRKTHKRVGRPKKRFPKRAGRMHKSLGGIPMKVVDGRIKYKQYVPHNYTKKYGKERGTYFEDKESVERKNAVIHQGRGDITRIMIYEIRFDIKRETDHERRKREYKEWWEKRRV